jgi:uncharacterized protein (DUF362 family)
MANELCNRRDLIRALGVAAAGYWLAPSSYALGRQTPTGSVAIGRCQTYGPETVSVLARMFDQIGGLEPLVKGKTVAIKLNLTGDTTDRVGNMPPELTHWVHPKVIGATVYLMGKAGARRVRLLESPWSTSEPVQEFMRRAGWHPSQFVNLAPRVEFENTNYLGESKRYVRFNVPGGGLMFAGYDLNHSYADCDVFVSLAKLKEHATAGVTLSMKNCFGITPCTIYGEGAGVEKPSLVPHGGRGMIHNGNRTPSESAPQPLHPHAYASKDPGYRVPRVTADLVASRPIHLAVIDGVYTETGGEGPWVRGVKPVHPGLLVAGRNCVATDAVAVALMGFDPMADRGTAPFEHSDSTLRLAQQLGVGTRDLSRIEVVGHSIDAVKFNFRAARAA